MSVVCCHVEVSATSRSLVQRSPTDYSVCVCGCLCVCVCVCVCVCACPLETSTTRRPKSEQGCCDTIGKIEHPFLYR